MRKRFIALLLAALLISGALAGCGEEEKAAQIRLRSISILGDEAEKTAYTAMLEAYSAGHPEVYHTGTVAQASYAYKLNATFESTYTASRYPHVVYYYTDTGIADLCDYFVPVDEIRESYPDFASGVSEAALDSVRAPDGKVYCIPFAGTWTAMAVNTALFDRYGLSLPRTWQELVLVCGIFSARGITPIANPPEDSAAILELLATAAGGADAMAAALSGDGTGTSEHSAAWQTAMSAYLELCSVNAFPGATLTDELSQYLALPDQTVSGTDQSAASGSSAQTADAIARFNGGGAAMLVLDREQLGRVTLEGCEIIDFPVSGITPDDNEYIFIGGFDTGYYITRRTFEDAAVRDAAVAFVDSMTGSAACLAFAQLGYLSPRSTESAADGGNEGGLLALSSASDTYLAGTRTSVNTARYSSLERIAAALSCRIVTPEQAATMALDGSVRLADVAAIPEPATPEPDGTAVSPTDAIPQQ